MAFNTLPLELNEQIAILLDTDREVCNFRLICHATNAAVQTYRCGVWRDRYARRYDMPEKIGGWEISMMYKLRSKLLRKSAKFLMGQEPREIRCMEVLRDLIIESYAHIPVGRKATHPSNNLEVIQRFVQRSRMLRKTFYCLGEKSNINPLLQTLQLILTHLELSIPSARANPPLGFAYSQFAVYSHPEGFPMFNAAGTWRISMNLLLHIANFFKHHLTLKGESTLYELFSQLEAHEKPKAWNTRLVQGGVQKLGRHWKGTYAYLHDLHEMDLIRRCEPGKEYFFTDSIDHHDGFQTLELDFEPQANRARWPKIFENHLDAMPTKDLCNILDGRPKTKTKRARSPQDYPKRGVHYRQFSGSGADAEPFQCSGILHPLPPQEQIPGWYRISMMKYFDPLVPQDSLPPQSNSPSASSQSLASAGSTSHAPYKSAGAAHSPNDMYQVDDDAEINAGCWAYEGAVLPGGKIILGRWWSPFDDDGLKRCMGPFIFWNVDKE